MKPFPPPKYVFHYSEKPQAVGRNGLNPPHAADIPPKHLSTTTRPSAKSYCSPLEDTEICAKMLVVFFLLCGCWETERLTG